MTSPTPVIANTSPILNLAAIGELELLRDQFGEITVPEGVIQELRPQEDLPGNEAIRAALREGWIKVLPIKGEALAAALAMELDRGEAEAIALALEWPASLVLIDEREGRTKAKALGLRITGVLGVILKADKQGKIEDLSETIRQLREEARFHLSDAIVSDVLAAAEKFRS